MSRYFPHTFNVAYSEFDTLFLLLYTLDDSDHDNVVRFFVGHSQGSERLIIYITLRLRGTIFPLPGVKHKERERKECSLDYFSPFACEKRSGDETKPSRH